jgi:hypothetical protein
MHWVAKSASAGRSQKQELHDMPSWIDSIMAPLHAASDAATGLVKIRDTVKFGEAVINLQGQIVAALRAASAAQQRETEMAGEISALKDQLTKMEAWEAEKQRYQLVQLPPSIFVYELKPESAAGEPKHYICQTCYQRGKKSILHGGEENSGVHLLQCHECGAKHQVGLWRPVPLPSRGGSWMSG